MAGRLINVECPHCAWSTLCGEEAMADWLRRIRRLRRDSDAAGAILVELFKAAAQQLACPECGGAGLVLEPHRGQVEEDWGDARLCEGCRKPIPLERLAVLPDATLCADCQTRSEQGETEEEPQFCPKCGELMAMRLSRAGGITRYVLRCPTCRSTIR